MALNVHYVDSYNGTIEGIDGANSIHELDQGCLRCKDPSALNKRAVHWNNRQTSNLPRLPTSGVSWTEGETEVGDEVGIGQSSNASESRQVVISILTSMMLLRARIRC